jgi:hypothetical protein
MAEESHPSTSATYSDSYPSTVKTYVGVDADGRGVDARGRHRVLDSNPVLRQAGHGTSEK